MENLPIRPRRNRKSAVVRNFHRETWLSPAHFVYPLFIHEGQGRQPIDSMPGCARLGLDELMAEVSSARALGIGAIVLFPAIDESLKAADARESHNPKGLVPRAIGRL